MPGIGVRYPIDIFLNKDDTDNVKSLAWINKVSKILSQTFKEENLMNFGTHYNLTFHGWEGMSEDQLLQRMAEVGLAFTRVGRMD